MASRAENNRDLYEAIELTAAAKMIGVQRDALFAELRKEGLLIYNAQGDTIANRTMTKLRYFVNGVCRVPSKPWGTIHELPLVTAAGREFLRDFCKEHEVPVANAPRKLPSRNKTLSVEGQLAREQCRALAEELA